MMKKLYFTLSLISAVSQLSYADQSPASAVTATTDPLISALTTLSNCDPASSGSICTYNVTDPITFLEYLAKCNLLNKWDINYSPVPGQEVTITATSAGACSLTLTNLTNNKKQVCALTQTDIDTMTSPAAITALQTLKQTPGTVIPSTIMETIFKPVDDCLKQNIPSNLRPLAHPNINTLVLPPAGNLKPAVGNTQSGQ